MSDDRTKLKKPDTMSDQEWAYITDATSSLERIKGDAKADVQSYLTNPAGRSTGGGASNGLPIMLLTTIGRKSGEKRTTPLVFLQDGNNVVIVGSLAGYDSHPAWYHNVTANPNCWIQLDDRKSVAVARDATDAERKALWPKLIAVFPPWGFFQDQTDRPFSIVIVSPTGPA